MLRVKVWIVATALWGAAIGLAWSLVYGAVANAVYGRIAPAQ